MHLRQLASFQAWYFKNKTNFANKYNRLKNPYWKEADQFATYKYKGDRGVELESAKKQLQPPLSK